MLDIGASVCLLSSYASRLSSYEFPVSLFLRGMVSMFLLEKCSGMCTDQIKVLTEIQRGSHAQFIYMPELPLWKMVS